MYHFLDYRLLTDYFWGIVSGLSAIVTIVVWARENLREKPRRLIYPLLLVLLTAISTCQFQQNRQLTAIRSEASSLVASWPRVDDLGFVSKGERIGIILGGLAFLEKHKEQFAETYKTATELVENRLRGFTPPEDWDRRLEESWLLEDVAGAIIQLVSSIAR